MSVLPPEVPGWLTEAQARRLRAAAERVPAGGSMVEIGSYRGRSTIVLAGATDVIAIDPHAGNDRGPGEWQSPESEGQRDHEQFLANLERAGVRERVRHVRKPSQDALGELPGPFDAVYVDGAHRYVPALADICAYGARVRPGGTLLIHDSFSSVGVTLAIVRALVPSPEWSYVGRDGSLSEYRRTPSPRVRNGARQLAQLPWFVRNLAIKLALTLRMRPLARALGSEEWPY